MSPQSTREKMRRAVKRAIKDQDRCMDNLKTLDTIAEGRLQIIDESLPLIIQATTLIQDTLQRLLREL